VKDESKYKKKLLLRDISEQESTPELIS